MVSAREVRDLLEDRPELEPAIEAVLDADEPFEFSDLDVDSGAFGEVVSAGIAESADGGYRVPDRVAVRTALDGPMEPSVQDGSTASWWADVELRLGSGDYVAVATLLCALVLTVLLRSLAIPKVFRDRVVLSGNDPYYYRYWVDWSVAASDGSLDATVLSNFPGTVSQGEPLYISTAWFVSSLSGGLDAVGTVLALYPLVSAVVTGILTYYLTRVVTDDRRIALASVFVLAVIPAYAARTSVGFADHHGFDYPWLVLTAIGLALALRERGESLDLEVRDVVATFALGVGISGQVLAWNAGPLLVVAAGLAAAVFVTVAVSHDSPLLASGMVTIAGLGLASLLSYLVHAGFGWQSAQVAFVPALLFVGVGVVFGAGIAFQRLLVSNQSPGWAFAGAELAILIIGLVTFRQLLPEYWTQLGDEVGRLLGEQTVAEVQPLFGTDLAGGLLGFGLVLFFALPYLGWATYRLLHGAREWTVPVTYGWWFLGLAALQVRFAGEFSPFAALFGGLCIVHISNRVDVAELPRPFRSTDRATTRSDGGEKEGRLSLPTPRQGAALLIVFLLVGGLGLVQTPIRIDILAHGEAYDTAESISEDAGMAGIEYPENYVLSEWGDNRMYNYFVSGESRSYSFARVHYGPFLSSTNATTALEHIRVPGYVVTETRDGTEFAPSSMQSRLHQNLGSANGSVEGVGHYELRYISPDGEYKVFRVVRGATLVGSANTTVTVTSDVTVQEQSFTYTRRVMPENGTYRVVVPYDGTYSVGGESVTVNGTQVATGGTVTVGD
jgi:dolichyl-diphosphooligosaccharide--protein glycosyltransferase